MFYFKESLFISSVLYKMATGQLKRSKQFTRVCSKTLNNITARVYVITKIQLSKNFGYFTVHEFNYLMKEILHRSLLINCECRISTHDDKHTTNQIQMTAL